MNTIKRPIEQPRILTSNYSKYFNHTDFHGIVHNKNIFEVDELSFEDAKNVYIDENNSLITREPLTQEELPDLTVPTGNKLIEILRAGNVRIYVSQEPVNNEFDIIAWDENTLQILNTIDEYHLSIIEHYVICFRTDGAMVLDINDYNTGWVPLTDLVEVPITKRVVGSLVTELPGNQFTDAFKEQYVWSNQSIPELPDGDGEVVVNTTRRQLTWTIPDTNVNTEYRILRPLGITLSPGDLITTARNIVCVARPTYVMLSYDEGETFTRVWYPQYTDGFKNVASVSRDGLCFFFVAGSGVYRLDLGTQEWTRIQPGAVGMYTLVGNYFGIDNICEFQSRDVFSFPLWNGTNTAIWALSPHTFNVISSYVGTLSATYDNSYNWNLPRDRIDKDCARGAMRMLVDTTNNNTIVTLIGPSTTVGQTRVESSYATPTLQFGAYAISPGSQNYRYMTVDKVGNLTTRQSTGNTARGLGLDVIAYTGSGNWQRGRVEVGMENISGTWTMYAQVTINGTIIGLNSSAGYPFELTGGWIADLMVRNNVGEESRLPDELDGEPFPDQPRGDIWVFGNDFYIQIGDIVYTNKLLDTDLATITYTHEETTPFTNVPQVSYSDTELYLAFGNLLQITANIKDGVDIRFNLPAINNNSFIDEITAMINISTSEVALYFVNKIVICSRVPDEIFGYRYEYYNTKLSLGVRLGDSVINTLEGDHTIFPTKRGLAVMNYQSFMATEDQVVKYATDGIIDIWQKFYEESETIRIVQMRNYVFFTNGTRNYIMLDLRNNTSWWAFELPRELPVTKFITDQTDLWLISDTYYLFNKQYKVYKDLWKYHIDWFVTSQRLFFKAPNHYKNMKQLVFQLMDATGSSSKQQTINAQVRLYRKTLTVREPEIVRFKIDEFRTFVKRFNYWKINELQWGIGNDAETVDPSQFMLNGIGVKFEIGEEVRS